MNIRKNYATQSNFKKPLRNQEIICNEINWDNWMDKDQTNDFYNRDFFLRNPESSWSICIKIITFGHIYHIRIEQDSSGRNPDYRKCLYSFKHECHGIFLHLRSNCKYALVCRLQSNGWLLSPNYDTPNNPFKTIIKRLYSQHNAVCSTQ